MTTNADGRLTWADQSPKGNDVSGRGPKLVRNELNGRAVLRLADNYFIRTGVPGTQLFSNTADTVLFVQKQLGSDPRTTTLSWVSPGDNRFMAHATYDDVMVLQVGPPSGSPAVTQPPGWDDAWHVVSYRRDGSNGLIRVDGLRLSDPRSALYTSAGNNAATADLYIGSDQWGNTFNGDLAEILVYNTALSDPDLASVEAALRAKYNLPLAAAATPDLLLKLTAEPADSFREDNLCQVVPEGFQIRTQAVGPGGLGSFDVKVKNGGWLSPLPRPIIVRASESAASGWSVTYKLGPSNISDAIAGAGGFATAPLGPGEFVVITVEIRMSGIALPGTVKRVTLGGCDSLLTNLVRDAVQAVALAAPGVQPDLAARRDFDPTAVGDNRYNLTGEGQTKWADIETNQTATYLVTLGNDGNSNGMFSLSAPAAASSWTVRYFDQALSFDGASGYVDLGGWSPGAKWTLEAWVKPAALPGGRHTILGGMNECRDWSIALHDGRFAMEVRNPGGCTIGYSSGVNAMLGEWVHVAATCDGANAVLYTNGVIAARGPVDANYVGTTSGTRIGGEVCCGNWFPGGVRAARVWDRPLGSNEIQSVMSQVLTGSEPGLVGYWPLDDGGPRARDLSPNSRHGTLVNGATWQPFEITSLLAGGSYTNSPMSAGASKQFTVTVMADSTVTNGAACELLLTAATVGDPTKADAVKLVTTAYRGSTTPVNALFTTTADFGKGRFYGTEADTVPDQVQLAAQQTTLPFLWVPNSDDGSVSKVDTRTGRELARYRVCPPGVTGNPSRTTVDLRGNCWVANRNSATVVKIGLLENGEYLDRNQDGLAQTSRDLDNDGVISAAEVLPWGQDECVLYEVLLVPGAENTYQPGAYKGTYPNNYWNPGPRSVAVDAQGNLWAGTHDTMKFYFIDGSTAQILRTIDTAPSNHTAYGAVIDAQGILWSSGYKESGAQNLLRLNTAAGSFITIPFEFHTYGLGLDRNNHLFVSGHQEGKLTRLNVLTGQREWTAGAGARSRGVAVTDDGDVWVVNSDARTVTRYANNGVVKASIAVGPEPTGVAVDAAGKVWVVGSGDAIIRRIDPATDTVDLSKSIASGGHYGYSDMTGVLVRNSTVRLGLWTAIHDARVRDTAWDTLSWHGADVTGTNLVVRVRSSNDRAQWSPWETAGNGAVLAATPPGRYLEMEVSLRGLPGVNPPVLYDIAAAGRAPAPVDLGVMVSATPNPVVSEHASTVSVTVTNLGANWASGLAITNLLPANFDVLAVSVPGGSYARVGTSLLFQFAGLAPHSGTVITVTGVPQPPAGDYALSASVSATMTDLNPADNTNSVVLHVTAPACVPPPPGIVGWWPGESNAMDVAGGNDGTVQGSVVFAPGKHGKGFTFDSNDDRVVIPHNDAFNPTRTGFSVQFWMKATKDQPAQSDSLVTLIEKSHGWVDYTGWALQAFPASGRLSFGLGNGTGAWSGADSLTDVLDNRWHYIIATWDGFTLRMYVDGALEGSCWSTFPANNLRPLNFGFTWANGSPRRFYRGQLDEVVIQNRALDEAEIAAAYEARSAGLCDAAPYIIQPAVEAEFAVGESVSQPLAAVGGLPPYTYALAAGGLPPGLALDQGQITGHPSIAGTYAFTVRVEDATHAASERAFTHHVYACVAPPSGLVGWWRAEHNTDDFAGTSHGTLDAGARYDLGKVGSAFFFDGIDDGVRLNGTAKGILDITANQLTVQAWVNVAGTNLPATGYGVIFDKNNDGQPDGYLLGVNRGQLEFTLATADKPGFGLGNVPLPVQRWVHVAGTYDGAMARLYVDGVEQAAAPLTGNLRHNNHDACIGNDNWPGSRNYSFNGLIDEVAVCNRALAPGEIAALANAGAAGQCVPTPADLLVKATGQPDSAYVGGQLYAAAPDPAQAADLSVLPLATASYTIKLVNNSGAPRAFVLRASETLTANWATVGKVGGADISAALHSATGFPTGQLPAGASLGLTMESTPSLRVPGATAQAAGLFVYADPVAATVLDVVQGVTTCLPTYQPDLAIRREQDVNFIGLGIINTTGAGQSKSLEIEAGATATYRVQLRNNGNLNNTFALTAPALASGWTVQYFDQALSFDGASGYVDLGGWSPGAKWTLEAWVKPAALPGGRRAILGGMAECRDWNIALHDGRFAMEVRNPGGCNLQYACGMNAVIGQWIHLAATCDGATAVLYTNGVIAARGPVDANYVATAAGTRIGGDSCCGDYFPGAVRAARIWDRPLGSNEIQSVMSQVLTGSEPGLVGYWPLDDGGPRARDVGPNARHGTLVNGATWQPFEITSFLAGGGYTNPPMVLGASKEFTVTVAASAGLPGGAASELLLTVATVGQAVKTDAVKAFTWVSRTSPTPEGGTYTSSEDFANNYQEAGVDYSSVPGQLQLATNSTTLPFLWVPNCEGTISKVDTRTGRELARYRTCPPGVNGQPSRTTVDMEGNCWVVNRYAGTVIKLGLLESGVFADRNGNGLADTARDANGDGDITGAELLPWGADECVLFEVMLSPGTEGTYTPGTFKGTYYNDWGMPGPRGVAVDTLGNCWVGTLETKKFYYISGTNGQILRIIDVSSINHRTYGAVLDPNGILWAASHDRNEVLRLDPATGAFMAIPLGHFSYGINADRLGHVFVSGWQDSRLSRINTATATKDWTVPGIYQSRGIAITDDGDVWVANSGPGTVARWSNNGVLKSQIPAGSVPTGVAVDHAGKIWALGLGDPYIRRIDPATDTVDLTKQILCTATGDGYHYGYSDMTGNVMRNTTTRLGTWTIRHNARVLNTPWGTLSWNALEPEGTSIRVRVRSSNNRQTWSNWELAANALALHSTPPGQFLEVEVTLQSAVSGLTPALLDLSILPATQANYGVLVYATDFDGPVGAEWSTNTASQTPTGARRFLGEFGNQTVTLGLSNLPPHTAATVVFDQFVLRHWLGNDTHTNDADVFEVNVAGGLKLVNASFNNGPAFGSGQSFPAPYPGATNAPLTGAAETNSLGYTFPGVGPLDSVYAHLYSFPHTAGTLVLNFQARGLASLAEASWGLDDVRVFLTPREGPPRIVPLGFAADGFVLELTVGWGWSYLLQGSENLSDWSNLDTGRAGADPVRITDAEALSKPHRFYRVLQTP